MKKIPHAFAIFVVVSTLVAISALGRPAAAQTVDVGNIEELYSAVNNAGNAGATVVLAPGLYPLTVNDANGSPRPNRGRLDLQPDMSLLGVTDDRSAVIIDASALP